jgi:hypothetical protein
VTVANAKRAFVTPELRKSLADIEASLERLARPTLAMLKPDVAADVVRPLLTRRGLGSPNDLYIDADGYLEEDYGAFAVLAAEINPDVPWWHQPVE